MRYEPKNTIILYQDVTKNIEKKGLENTKKEVLEVYKNFIKTLKKNSCYKLFWNKSFDFVGITIF